MLEQHEQRQDSQSDWYIVGKSKVGRMKNTLGEDVGKVVLCQTKQEYE